MISSSSDVEELRTTAALIEIDFQNMLVKWGSSQPPRTGLHASSLLVSEQEWCPRRHVLSELFPDEADPPPMHLWDWRKSAIFENGWDVHRRWQRVFEKWGKVVRGYGLFCIGDAPELDLTHFDADRHLLFSPDAILEFGGMRYVVEIKGINHNAFLELTDDLETAMASCETVHKAVIQANLYMHLLDLRRAIILVENKNTQAFRLWVTEYSKEVAQPYVQRAYQVKGHVAMSRTKGRVTVPRVCQSPDSPLARGCAMRTLCFREEENQS